MDKRMLDKEIIRIQNSTRTTFQWFSRYHDFFRMRSSLYYRWHLNPRADLYHFFTLLIVIAAVVSSIFLSYSGGFIDQTKADSGSVTLDSQADWQAGTSDSTIDLASSPGDIKLNPTWTQATASAGWQARQGQASVVFDGKFWIIGGNGAAYKNDVWYSSNGSDWTQATAAAGWSARTTLSAVVFDNKMWVLGGATNATTNKNDVWYSSNGSDWTQATAAAGWSVRNSFTSFVFDNKMWVVGGNAYPLAPKERNDVWYSSNGSDWTQATAAAGWTARYAHTSLVFDNKIWVLGGVSPGGVYKNDVWYSSNGSDWTQATASANWLARYYLGSATFGSKIYVFGGYNDDGNFGDVWYSSNGVSWTQAAIPNWLARSSFSYFQENNNIWVLGGYSDLGKSNDVWHSSWSGTHTTASTQIDGGAGLTGWTTFEPSSTIPTNTAVSFRFRTSADGTSWTAWSASAPYASSLDISGQSASNRYFQVETTLSNTDGGSIPSLDSYTVNFSTAASEAGLNYLEVKLSSEADSEYDVARNVALESSSAEATLTVDTRGIDTLGAVMTGLVFTLTSDSCLKTADNQFRAPQAGGSCTVTSVSDQGGSATMYVSVGAQATVVEPEPSGASFIYALISTGTELMLKDDTETFSAEAYNQNDQNITNQCTFAWTIAPSALGTIIEQRNNAIDLIALKTGEYEDGIKVTAACDNLSDDDTKDIAIIDTLVPNGSWDWTLSPEAWDYSTQLNMAIKVRFDLWASFFESGKMYYFPDFDTMITLTNSEAGELAPNRTGRRFAYFVPKKEGCYPNLVKGEYVSGGKTYTAFAGLTIASDDSNSPNYKFRPALGDFELRIQHIRASEEVDYGLVNTANSYDTMKNRIPTVSPYFSYSKNGNNYNFIQKNVYYRYRLNDTTIGYITPNDGVFRASENIEMKTYPNAITVTASFNGSSITKNFDIIGVPKNELVYSISGLPESITVAPGEIFHPPNRPDLRRYIDQWGDGRTGFYEVSLNVSGFTQYQPLETYFKAPTNAGSYNGAIRIKNTRNENGEEKLINVIVDPSAEAELCDYLDDDYIPPEEPVPPSPECVGDDCATTEPENPSEIPLPSDIISIIILLFSVSVLASAPSLLGVMSPMKHLARGIIIPALLGYAIPLPIVRGRNAAIIYDQTSKYPIPYAAVYLYDFHSRLLSKTLANEFGGFVLVKPSTIGRVEVKKRGFKPAEDPGGNSVANFEQSDGEYRKVYYSGQKIENEKFGGDIFVMSIPMIKTVKSARTSKFMTILREIASIFNRYQIIILIAGSALAFYLWWQSKSDTLSILIALGYLFLWLFEVYGLLTYQKIEGRVINDGGEAVSGALIRIYDKKGKMIQSTASDEAGRFSVGLTRKDYSLDAHKSGFGSVREFSIPYYKLKNLINIKLSKPQ